LFLPDEWLGPQALEKKAKNKQTSTRIEDTPEVDNQQGREVADSVTDLVSSANGDDDDEAADDDAEDDDNAEFASEHAEFLDDLEELKSLTGREGAKRVLHRTLFSLRILFIFSRFFWISLQPRLIHNTS
jgi:hypothetical protein